MTEIPSSIRPLFLAAGWHRHPGRRVAVPPTVPAQHPGAAVLAEFGGLAIGQSGAGEECATSDVAFQLLGSDASIIRAWNKLLRTELVGVANIQNAHAELYLDTRWRFFWASCIDDGFCFEGASFSEAMERLLLGRRHRPMLRPDQHEVTMYGEVITTDDPRIYKYA
jgi:hypothetical protein